MTSAIARIAIAAPNRGGLRHWLRSFRCMLRWDLVRMRMFLPVLVMVQIFTGAGLVLGFSLLSSNISPDQVLFLGTWIHVLSDPPGLAEVALEIARSAA